MGMVITIERADGGTSVVHPTPQQLAKFATETEALEAIRSKVVPGDAVSSEIVDSSVLPNRTFRDAWKKGAGSVSVDMPMARTIHLEKIRIVRNAKLIEEDANWNKTADKGTVEARRVALRDLPNSSQTATDIAAAADPATLDAIWPIAELGVRV